MLNLLITLMKGRSITGYLFLLAGAPLSCNCQTQHTTALYTMESEYYAVCKAVQEALYLRMMFEKTGLKVDSPLTIREDNKACISFSKDPGEHKCTKHIDYRHFFVRDQVNDGEVSLTHVSSENQLSLLMLNGLFSYEITLLYFVQHCVV